MPYNSATSCWIPDIWPDYPALPDIRPNPMLARYMVESAVYLGATREVAEEQMKKALSVEMALANISIPREEKLNITALNNHVRRFKFGLGRI